MPFEEGLIHVYTGDGKGKTTAAFGLAARAAGQGMRVAVIQFMKGRRYGEVKALERIDGIEIYQFGRDEFVSRRDPLPVDVSFGRAGFEKAVEIMQGGGRDLLVLDEINVAIDYGLVSKEELLDALSSRRPTLEVVLTGRNAPPEILEAADLVTEMREVKHYYRRGIEGRAGVEY